MVVYFALVTGVTFFREAVTVISLLRLMMLFAFLGLSFSHLAILNSYFFIGCGRRRHQKKRITLNFGVVNHLTDLALLEVVEVGQSRHVCSFY